MGRSAQRSLGPVAARHLQGLQVRSYQSSSASELLRGYGLVAGVFASCACRRTNPQNSHDSAQCWAFWRSGCQAGVIYVKVFKKYLLHLLLHDCIHKIYIPKGCSPCKSQEGEGGHRLPHAQGLQYHRLRLRHHRKNAPEQKCSIIVRGTSRSESRVRTLPDGSFRHRVRTIILGCCLHCSFYHNCRVPSTHCQVYKLFYTMHTLLFPFTFCDIYVKSCTYTSQLWLLIPGTP